MQDCDCTYPDVQLQCLCEGVYMLRSIYRRRCGGGLTFFCFCFCALSFNTNFVFTWQFKSSVVKITSYEEFVTSPQSCCYTSIQTSQTHFGKNTLQVPCSNVGKHAASEMCRRSGKGQILRPKARKVDLSITNTSLYVMNNAGCIRVR